LQKPEEEPPVIREDLDKKVTELKYLLEKIRTIYDGSDGIINEDISYSEKFNTSEVQRMIELLSSLSDAELRAAEVLPDDEDSYETFRRNLRNYVDMIKGCQEEMQ
jgi:hypothetical protein